MQWAGIFIGIFSFLIIGLYHPIVIKFEYYFTSRVWPVFLLCGLLSLAAALFMNHVLPSALLGVLGFTNLWSIKEIKEQEERVKKGWFPENPARKPAGTNFRTKKKS